MISVCITTFNGEKHIKDQLDSILCQLSDDDEVIVSDDGSTDGTLSILRDYNDDRLRIIKNTRKQGVIGNVENALEQVKGDYIFLSDQDDIWLPHKVEITLNALVHSHLVISDCYVTDENLNILHDSFFRVNKSHTNKWLALLRNPYLGCCMSFRRSVLNIALPFPDNIPMHDIWIGNIAAFNFNLSFLSDKLIYYRRHNNNASTTSEPSNLSILEKMKNRYNTVSYLIKRLFLNK